MRHHNTQCVIWWCGLRRSSTLHDGTKKKGGKKKGNTWSSILPSDKVAEKMRILNFVASLYRCQNIHVILRVPNELYQFFVFLHQKTMQTKQDKKKEMSCAWVFRTLDFLLCPCQRTSWDFLGHCIREKRTNKKGPRSQKTLCSHWKDGGVFKTGK